MIMSHVSFFKAHVYCHIIFKANVVHAHVALLILSRNDHVVLSSLPVESQGLRWWSLKKAVEEKVGRGLVRPWDMLSGKLEMKSVKLPPISSHS